MTVQRPVKGFHPCLSMGQTISGNQNVKQMVRKTVHVIVKHPTTKPGNANWLKIMGIDCTNTKMVKSIYIYIYIYIYIFDTSVY